MNEWRGPIGEASRKRLTIGRLLGAAGCFALVFATALYVEDLGSWVFWFALLPMLGGVYGTYQYGIQGFVEGALYGALFLPLCLMLLSVVIVWVFLLSIIL